MSGDFLNTLNLGDEIYMEIFIDQEIQNLKTEVLEFVNANKIIVSCPMFKGRIISLNPGERYRMFHPDEESGLYQFVGMVVSRDKVDQIVRIHILRVSDVKKSQRREFFRLSLIEDAIISIPDGEGVEELFHQGKIIKQVVPLYKQFSVIVKDLSAGGMRVHSKRNLQPGETYRMSFVLENEKYDVECQIVRSFLLEDVVERYDLGIKFINIDLHLQRKLVAVIFEKQRKLLKKGMI